MISGSLPHETENNMVSQTIHSKSIFAETQAEAVSYPIFKLLLSVLLPL